MSGRWASPGVGEAAASAAAEARGAIRPRGISRSGRGLPDSIGTRRGGARFEIPSGKEVNPVLAIGYAITAFGLQAKIAALAGVAKVTALGSVVKIDAPATAVRLLEMRSVFAF